MYSHDLKQGDLVEHTRLNDMLVEVIDIVERKDAKELGDFGKNIWVKALVKIRQIA